MSAPKAPRSFDERIRSRGEGSAVRPGADRRTEGKSAVAEPVSGETTGRFAPEVDGATIDALWDLAIAVRVEHYDCPYRREGGPIPCAMCETVDAVWAAHAAARRVRAQRPASNAVTDTERDAANARVAECLALLDAEAARGFASDARLRAVASKLRAKFAAPTVLAEGATPVEGESASGGSAGDHEDSPQSGVAERAEYFFQQSEARGRRLDAVSRALDEQLAQAHAGSAAQSALLKVRASMLREPEPKATNPAESGETTRGGA